jgi:Legume lectin domain/YDG domain
MRRTASGFLFLTILGLCAHVARASDALSFFNNWFVTGDYAVGGVGLRGTGVNGWATGTINMAGVPAGAEPVAAFLYWSTVERSLVPTARVGYFNGHEIQAAVLGDPQNPSPACWSSGGTTGPKGSAAFVYRADVLRYLPVDANNVRLANGAQTVKLPDSGGNGNGNVLYTNGATLVVIYRIVAPGNPSVAPLRAVVIYDGTYTMNKHSSAMTQNVAGFYQASAASAARITGIVSNGQPGFSSPLSVNGATVSTSPFVGAQGSRWDNSTYSFSLAANAASFSTMMTVAGNQTCLTSAALIVSMNVQDTDGDGLLDVWETKGLHRNTQVSPATFGTCSDYSHEQCVDLPHMGANPNVKDIFVQMDWMHGAGDGTGGIDGAGTHDHMPKIDALSAVAQTFALHGINLHFDVGNHDQNTCAGMLCSFIVPAGYAQGGSDIDESTLVCHNTSAHPCNYDAPYPVLSFEYGFASIRDGNHLLGISPHLAQNRKDIFHYGLFAHALAGPFDATGHPVDPTTGAPTDVPKSYSGIAHRPGGGFMVTLGLWRSDIPANDQVGSALVQAGTLMHELGHNLDLSHGGLSTQPNCMPNYQSVMNYLYQTRGLTDAAGGEHIDYSHGTGGGLSETAPGPLGAMYRVRFYGPLGPSTPPGAEAQLHCNGTAIAPGELLEVRTEGSSPGTPDWTNGTAIIRPFDLNYDGTVGQNFTDQPDWTSLNLQQIGSGYRFGGLSLGAFATDGGVFATDGGVFATDAGALATDGGVFATDGGAFATDGGAFATDGGVFATDGGVFATDGGAFATDAGDLDYPTAILSSVDPPTVTVTNTIDANVVTIAAPDNGKIATYNVYRCAGAGCTPVAPAFASIPGGTAVQSFTDTVNDHLNAGSTCPATATCYNTSYTYTVTSLAVINSKLIESLFSQPPVSSEVTHLFVIADNHAAVYGDPIPSPTYTIYGDITGSLASGVHCAYALAVPRNVGTYSILCSGPATASPTDGVTYNASYLSYAPGVLTITPRPITVTAAASTKTYDGTTSSPATPTITLGSLAYIDTPTFTETYDNKNVGTNHVMTPTGTVSDGNGGNNYSVTFKTINTGVINPLPIDLSALSLIGTNYGTGHPALPTWTDGALRLTNDVSETSAAWLPTPIDVSSAFSTSFQFRITPVNGGQLADGFAFVIQNAASGAATLGMTGQGGYIGYAGIPNSIAIEFDTYQNGWDPDDQHVGIQSNGTGANSAEHTSPARIATPVSATFKDGSAHTATITYDGTTLKVFLDSSTTPIINASFNLSTRLSLQAGKAYVGFTAATGAAREYSDILTWTWQ